MTRRSVRRGEYGLVLIVGYYDDDDDASNAIVYLGPMLTTSPLIVPRRHLVSVPDLPKITEEG